MVAPEERVVSEGAGEALVLALGDAERRVTRRLAQVLAREGCTVERWRALTHLAGDESHDMTALAEATQLPPASVTRLVDALVADNLAHRRPDPGDRRRVLVHLTPRGRDLRRTLSQRIAAEGDAILGAAGGGDVAELLEALATLRAGLR